MDNFLAELKRRHVYRVAAAYAVVAWVLLQLVNNLAPGLNLPNSAITLVIVLLGIGFPVCLVFAWAHQLNTESGALAKVTTGKLDWALVLALVAVLAAVSYQQLMPTPRSTTQEAGVQAARAASAAPDGGVAIAVLPFANMSGDAGQEFFSDGMTEEITAALVKVPDLRVVARTSAFQFKAQNRDIQSIGQQLHATHLIEGSVRKAGDRLRVTVQLVKADDGTHLWAENYDRQLTDIFAIQEDIARTITTSLNMSLGLKPGENLVTNRNVDPNSHEKLLRAKALYDSRSGTFFDYAQAESLLNNAIAKHPDYARAWALLSAVYYEHANHEVDPNQAGAATRIQPSELRSKGEAAARRAIEADPNLAWAYAMSAVFYWSRAKPLEAEELFAKALALDPTDAYVLDEYANRLAVAGRVKDALAMREKARAIEPFQPGILRRTVVDLWVNGQNDAAIALARSLRLTDRAPLLARIYASMGRYGEAADALMEMAGSPGSPAGEAARVLRTAPAPTPFTAALLNLPQELQLLYVHVGAAERTLDAFGYMAEAGYFWGTNPQFVWHTAYAPVRKTDRFKTLFRKAGLVEYWRAKGWPAQCHPTTGDDFVCE